MVISLKKKEFGNGNLGDNRAEIVIGGGKSGLLWSEFSFYGVAIKRNLRP